MNSDGDLDAVVMVDICCGFISSTFLVLLNGVGGGTVSAIHGKRWKGQIVKLFRYHDLASY